LQSFAIDTLLAVIVKATLDGVLLQPVARLLDGVAVGYAIKRDGVGHLSVLDVA